LRRCLAAGGPKVRAAGYFESGGAKHTLAAVLRRVDSTRYVPGELTT